MASCGTQSDCPLPDQIEDLDKSKSKLSEIEKIDRMETELSLIERLIQSPSTQDVKASTEIKDDTVM